MIGALRRLQVHSRGDALPDQLAAFGITGRFAGGLAALFSSHPPIEQRIAALSAGGHAAAVTRRQ
jgi:heat shock protein HtpX